MARVLSLENVVFLLATILPLMFIRALPWRCWWGPPKKIGWVYVTVEGTTSWSQPLLRACQCPYFPFELSRRISPMSCVWQHIIYIYACLLFIVCRKSSTRTSLWESIRPAPRNWLPCARANGRMWTPWRLVAEVRSAAPVVGSERCFVGMRAAQVWFFYIPGYKVLGWDKGRPKRARNDDRLVIGILYQPSDLRTLFRRSTAMSQHLSPFQRFVLYFWSIAVEGGAWWVGQWFVGWVGLVSVTSKMGQGSVLVCCSTPPCLAG